MPLLFSYGTLQRPDVQLSTFGRLLKGQPDQIAGCEESTIQITDAAEAAALGQTHHVNLVWTGRKDSAVHGSVFEITDSELAAADDYERPAGYDRQLVPLASGSQAWVYTHG